MSKGKGCRRGTDKQTDKQTNIPRNDQRLKTYDIFFSIFNFICLSGCGFDIRPPMNKIKIKIEEKKCHRSSVFGPFWVCLCVCLSVCPRPSTITTWPRYLIFCTSTRNENRSKQYFLFFEKMIFYWVMPLFNFFSMYSL